MLALVHRIYWWIIRRLCKPTMIHGIEFVDLRDDQGDTSELVRLLADAIRLIDASPSRAVFRVGVRLVAAMTVRGSRRGGPSPPALCMVLPFTGPERHNYRLLASQLVWGAAYNDQYRKARQGGWPFDGRAGEHAAYDAQVDFVKTFPDAPDWLEHLQPQRPTPDEQ